MRRFIRRSSKIQNRGPVKNPPQKGNIGPYWIEANLSTHINVHGGVSEVGVDDGGYGQIAVPPTPTQLADGCPSDLRCRCGITKDPLTGVYGCAGCDTGMSFSEDLWLIQIIVVPAKQLILSAAARQAIALAAGYTDAQGDSCGDQPGGPPGWSGNCYGQHPLQMMSIRSRNPSGGALYVDVHQEYDNYAGPPSFGDGPWPSEDVTLVIPLGPSELPDFYTGTHFAVFWQTWHPIAGDTATQAKKDAYGRCAKTYDKFCGSPEDADTPWSPLLLRAQGYNDMLPTWADVCAGLPLWSNSSGTQAWHTVVGFASYEVDTTFEISTVRADGGSCHQMGSPILGVVFDTINGHAPVDGLQIDVTADVTFTIELHLVDLIDMSDYVGGLDNAPTLRLTAIPNLSKFDIRFPDSSSPSFTTDGGTRTSPGHYTFVCQARKAGIWFFDYTPQSAHGMLPVRTPNAINVGPGTPHAIAIPHVVNADWGTSNGGSNKPQHTAQCASGALQFPITVGIYDVYGNLCTSATNVVTLAASADVGSLGDTPRLTGTNPRAAVAGLAIFDDIRLYGLSFNGHIKASSPGLVNLFSDTGGGNLYNDIYCSMDLTLKFISGPTTCHVGETVSFTFAIVDVDGNEYQPTNPDVLWLSEFEVGNPFVYPALHKGHFTGAEPQAHSGTMPVAGRVTISGSFPAPGVFSMTMSTDYDTYAILVFPPIFGEPLIPTVTVLP